jgi:hypothetical protein
MRHQAAAAHPDLKTRLLAGHVPGGMPAALAAPLDGILLSAVVVHIPDAELFEVALELPEVQHRKLGPSDAGGFSTVGPIGILPPQARKLSHPELEPWLTLVH